MKTTTKLIETLNNESVNQNIKPVADFFRMHGEETAAHYSSLIFEVSAILHEHYLNQGKSLEETEDMLFDFKQLNKLMIELKNPVQWVTDSE